MQRGRRATRHPRTSAHTRAQVRKSDSGRDSSIVHSSATGILDASSGGMNYSPAAYQIDANWQIVRANDAFCRLLQCRELDLIGRDIRLLLREDWRLDFRTYVARALIGVGDYDATVPMVALSGESCWFKHSLRPIVESGLLTGYRATIEQHGVTAAAPAMRWWDWRPVSPRMVWDFELQPQPLAKAS
jgi:PAS domain S-box-containing protein